MAVLKCKKCSAPLDIIEGLSVLECPYCNTKETVSFTTDEKRINLYNQANALRIKCDFDRAANIYESIIAEFPDEAEAYWCLCLCNYGIEYVDDPVTTQKIPTCHRASFESMKDDENFKKALKYADTNAQRVYREEAQKIDGIIDGILSVCKNEKPYDIFICYKEKDENNERTVDSVLAEELYDALTDKGYKVFFSLVSLRNKSGIEFEPYIFAALNSAKVMLAVGTRAEYYDSTWVKNEWSRFLRIAAKDKSKAIFPCFKDMPAKDLPKEFKALHAQDLGRVGILNDIVRGIESIIPLEKATVAPVVTVTGGEKTEPLLKRVFIFLEDGDFNAADEYCEKVLDINPECAEAYLGKTMAELKVRNKNALSKQAEPFSNNKNFQKAVRYATNEQKVEYEGYIDTIIASNNEKAYQYAVSKMEDAYTREEFQEAAELFEEISGYKDADELAEECLDSADEFLYDFALDFMKKADTKDAFLEVAEWFEEISGYKDADELAEECRAKSEEAYSEAQYKKAVEIYNNPVSLSQLQKAEDIFNKIIAYKDSNEYLAKIPERVEEFKKEEIYTFAQTALDTYTKVVALQNALREIEKIDGYKDSAELKQKLKEKISKYEADEAKYRAVKKREAKKARAKKRGKTFAKIVVIVLLIAAIVGGIAYVIHYAKVVKPRKKYEAAVADLNKGNYQAAYDSFVALGDYEDAAAQAEKARVPKNKAALKNCKVGDTVALGTYNVGGYKNNEYFEKTDEIEWQVLDIKDGKVLLISKYVVDTVAYNNEKGDITWELCSLRKWLNEDFMNTAFKDVEKELIATTVLEAEEKPSRGTIDPKSTEDKIFILTKAETEKYFPNREERICAGTIYVKEEKEKTGWNGNYDWWLRGAFGYHQNISAAVDAYDGDIEVNYQYVEEVRGVRPVMWIDLNNIK